MRKLKKTSIIFLVVMVLTGLSANFIVKAIFYQIIENVNNDQKYPLTITYKKTRFNVFFGNVVVKGLEIIPKPNTTQINGKFSVDKLSISGLDLKDILDKNFTANNIELNGPVFTLYSGDEEGDSTKTSAKAGKKFGTLFTWKNLVIKNGSFKVVDNEDGFVTTNIKGVNIQFGSKTTSTVNDFFGEGMFKTGAISINIFK